MYIACICNIINYPIVQFIKGENIVRLALFKYFDEEILTDGNVC